MIKLKVIVLIVLACNLNGYAQDSKLKIPAIPQKEDQLIVSITSDNWSGLSSTLESKPIRSRGFSLLLMTDRMRPSGNFGVGFGLGFNSQNVHTNAIVADTTVNGSFSSLIKIPDSLGYKYNKLSLNFITAALEIRLRSNENSKGHRFKLSAGIMAGFLLQSHTKYKDKNGKFKTYNIDHLNNFQYGIEARLGYHNYAINGYYSLVNVFKDKKGPELTPYSIGVSFTF